MRSRRWLFLFGLLGLIAPPVRATQVILLDTPTLTRGSRDIVVGRVAATRSYWNATRTKIYTDVTVEVEEALKGGAAGTLTLTQLGGTVDGAHYDVPGSPTFVAGEEALLFVWRGPSGRAQVNGLSQGKFDIRVDPASGEKLVQRSLPGMAVKNLRTLALTGDAATAMTKAFRLADFEAVIAETVSSQAREQR